MSGSIEGIAEEMTPQSVMVNTGSRYNMIFKRFLSDNWKQCVSEKELSKVVDASGNSLLVVYEVLFPVW